MQNLLKIALLPCLAALTFAAAPVAQAVTISSNAPTASTLASGTTSATTPTKQQKKLLKKCAKLSSGNLNARKRAKLMAMCQTTAANTAETNKPTPPATSNAGGSSGNNNAGGSSGNSGGGGGSSNEVLDLLQSSPSVLLPLVVGTEKTDGETSDGIASLLVREAPNAVPEPGSLALLGLGLIGLGFSRRRAAR